MEDATAEQYTPETDEIKTIDPFLEIFLDFTRRRVNSVGAKKFTFITSSKLSRVAKAKGATIVKPAQLTNPSKTGNLL